MDGDTEQSLMFVAEVDDANGEFTLTSVAGRFVCANIPSGVAPVVGDMFLVPTDASSFVPMPPGIAAHAPLIGRVDAVTGDTVVIHHGINSIIIPANELSSGLLENEMVEFRPHVGVLRRLSSADADPPALESEFFVAPVPTGATLNDVNGQDEIVGELKRITDDFVAGKLNPSVRGVLLEGPPGTGKTMMATAVANTVAATFFQVQAKSVNSRWVNHSEEKLRQLFRQARACDRSVIFFDEVDSIGLARSDSHSSSLDGMVNQLLAEMQGLVQTSNVLVLGATNRADLLDPALTRPGRFYPILRLHLPDGDARYATLIGAVGAVDHSVLRTLLHVADGTDGWSGADLVALCDTAADRRNRDGRTVTRVEDILLGWAEVSRHRAMREST